MARAPAAKEYSIISVGSYSIKAFRCLAQDHKIKVLAWETHRIEQQLTTQSPFADFVSELDKSLNGFKQGIFKDTTDLHLIISAGFLIVKVLGVPEFAKTDLKLVLQDKLERDNAVSSKPNGLKDFDYSSVLFDGLKEEDKVEEQMDLAVLVCLCEKVAMQAITKLFDGYEFRLVGIWGEAIAMAGLLARCAPQSWSEQVALVNIGHTLTSFYIFSEGKLLFYRPIFTAGQQITKDVMAITNDETIDAQQAEELKHKMTLNPKSVDTSQLTPLEALIHNISEQAILKEFSIVRKLDITFEYLSINIKKRIKNLFYTGGTSNLTGFVDHVAKNTSLPKGERLDAGASATREIDWPPGEGELAFSSYSACLGLAYALDGGIYKEQNLVPKLTVLQLIDPMRMKAVLLRHLGKVILGIESIAIVCLIGFFLYHCVPACLEISKLQKKLKELGAIPLPEMPEGLNLEELEAANKGLESRLKFYEALLSTRTNWVMIYLKVAKAIPASNLALTSLTSKMILKKIEMPTPGAPPVDPKTGPQEPPMDHFAPELVLIGVSSGRQPVFQFKENLIRSLTNASISLEKISQDPASGEGESAGGSESKGPGSIDRDHYFTIRIAL